MNGINFIKRPVIKNASSLFCLCLGLATTFSVNAEPLIPVVSNDSSASPSLLSPVDSSTKEFPSDTNKVISQLGVYSQETQNVETTAQNVTSVSQLSDVQPTDWAFTALQSLVERYGCIAGYPDRTYRGQRATSRYEFAAGLNACLDKINELISSGLADKVSKEDLAALKKLQEEFAAELALLKGRVDALEAKTATLESQQFSTTTKLSGLAFFNLTGATAGSNVKYQNANTGQTEIATNPNATLSGLVWLTFVTSFTGKDLLVTQLAAGNGSTPANNYFDPGFSTGFFNSSGTPFTDQTAGATSNSVILRELSYQFPVFENARLVVGPRVNFYKYFDNNRFTLFLNGTTSFNSINSTLLTNAKRGAGAIFLTPLGKSIDFALGFLSESNEFLPGNRAAADPAQGLFGGNNALTAEITFKPSNDLNLRFLYSRTNMNSVSGCLGGVGATPSLPGTAGIRPCGNTGGGGLTNGQSDVFVANFDWLATKGIGLFGRYSISFSNLNATNGSVGSVTTQAFQAGLAFPDLFKEGAQGTISFVMPFNFTSGKQFLQSGSGDGGTQYDLEVAYYFPINKFVSVIPAVYAIFNPNNFSSNPTVTVANLRVQFAF